MVVHFYYSEFLSLGTHQDIRLDPSTVLPIFIILTIIILIYFILRLIFFIMDNPKNWRKGKKTSFIIEALKAPGKYISVNENCRKSKKVTQN